VINPGAAMHLLRSISPFLLILLSSGCDKETGPVNYSFTGKAQKGPFVTGTSVTLNEMNSSLGQTGRSFATTILSTSVILQRYTRAAFERPSLTAELTQLLAGLGSDLADNGEINREELLDTLLHNVSQPSLHKKDAMGI
jgi:hypothetical protein